MAVNMPELVCLEWTGSHYWEHDIADLPRLPNIAKFVNLKILRIEAQLFLGLELTNDFYHVYSILAPNLRTLRVSNMQIPIVRRLFSNLSDDEMIEILRKNRSKASALHLDSLSIDFDCRNGVDDEGYLIQDRAFARSMVEETVQLLGPGFLSDELVLI